MILLDFEKEIMDSQKGVTFEVSDAAINEKYEKGEARIITEQGAVKLSLVNQVFNSDNYELRPKYQRRITWDSKKRSKLIESFIMNVPVPPVFIYETDFNRYQVMDGLQRITAIIDFYKDCYELEELTQWPELNGKICEIYYIFFDLPCPSQEKSLYSNNSTFWESGMEERPD